MARSILQDWVSGLTFMQQSVLLTAIRGCDGLPKYHVSKFLLRWFRRCILYSAFQGKVMTDPFTKDGGNFLGVIPAPEGHNLNDWSPLDQMAKEYLKSVDEIPHHFHLHVVHAAEILGYKHPDA
jgi:hypothetical protein